MQYHGRVRPYCVKLIYSPNVEDISDIKDDPTTPLIPTQLFPNTTRYTIPKLIRKTEQASNSTLIEISLKSTSVKPKGIL